MAGRRADLVLDRVLVQLPRPDPLPALSARAREAVQRRGGAHRGHRTAGDRSAAAAVPRHQLLQLPRRRESRRRPQARLPAPASDPRPARPEGRPARGLRRAGLHLRHSAQRVRHRLCRKPAPPERGSRGTRSRAPLARPRGPEPPRRPDLRRPLPVPPAGPLDRRDRPRPPLTQTEETPMKRCVLLILIAACSGKYEAPPPVASIALPDGSQLKPYDPAKPGLARPQGLAAAAGRVYVTLSNQRDTATFPENAGPGFLAAFVPSTGAITLVDLGGSDGRQCQNPGFVRASA